MSRTESQRKKDVSQPSFDGLIFAVNLDRKGGAADIPQTVIQQELSKDSLTWVHLDYSAKGVGSWLRETAGLDNTAISALTAEETRPRCTPHRKGLIVILRGVNLNPESDREDMVSLRIWMDKHMIITLRQRVMKTPQLVHECLLDGYGPKNQGDLLVALAEQINLFIGEVVNDLEEEMDSLEESLMGQEDRVLRSRLAEIRRETIIIRRYLAPQREAMSVLTMVRQPWLDDYFNIRMREVADRSSRFIEDLDAVRDRGMVTHEELTNKIAERMNRIMYFLSLVTGIFLPLGLLTGLLGINVGGMPGSSSDSAFWIVCFILTALVAFQYGLYKKMKWL